MAKHGGTAFYYSGIVGAGQCAKSPKRCDLSKGIVADPASNTVTFHLIAPDPDFLHKLTLPAAFAVPAATPLTARLPLPATGPYMIASYNAKRGVRFIRNPQFHQWSAAAQPSGYPDEIVLTVAESPRAQLRAVERGAADLSQFVPPSPAFRSRYAGQLQSNPQTNTGYFFLNTRVPPFDDVRVRRAVNLAIDRNRQVELNGGPRILTTDLPGTTAELRRLPAVLPLHDRPSSRRCLHGPRSREGPGARRCVRHPWTAGDRPDRRR